jgi:hypothetical protein
MLFCILKNALAFAHISAPESGRPQVPGREASADPAGDRIHQRKRQSTTQGKSA